MLKDKIRIIAPVVLGVGSVGVLLDQSFEPTSYVGIALTCVLLVLMAGVVDLAERRLLRRRGR